MAYTSQYSGSEIDAAITAARSLKPIFTTARIPVASWSAYSGTTMSPYTHYYIYMLTDALGSDYECELLNDQPVLFANHGFAFTETASGQALEIMSIGLPHAETALTFRING